MKKVTIICLFLIVCFIHTSYVIGHGDDNETPNPQESVREDESVETPRDGEANGFNHQEKGSRLAFGALNAFSVVALYSHNEKFREYCDAQTSTGKHYLLRSVVLPSLMKVEQIKDEGFSLKDFLKLGATVTTCYGIKKMGEGLNLWNALWTRDFNKTKVALTQLKNFVSMHKGKIALGGAVLCGALFLWRLSKAIDECTELSTIDRFFHSLTPEQRMQMVASSELSELVSQGSSNPMVLKTHESFMSLLREDQKKLLAEAVDEYVKTNDPLALLEGLDD